MLKKSKRPLVERDLQLLLGLVRRDPGVAHELVEGKADADGEGIADLRADRFANLEQDLAALADGAAVTVGAVVEGGAQELAEQIAVRRVQLHPVATRDLYVESRLPESLDHVVDVLLLHDHRESRGARSRASWRHPRAGATRP